MRLLGFAEARLRQLGSVGEDFDAAFMALRQVLIEDAVARLAAEGAMMTEDEAAEEVTKL